MPLEKKEHRDIFASYEVLCLAKLPASKLKVGLRVRHVPSDRQGKIVDITVVSGQLVVWIEWAYSEDKSVRFIHECIDIEDYSAARSA